MTDATRKERVIVLLEQLRAISMPPLAKLEPHELLERVRVTIEQRKTLLDELGAIVGDRGADISSDTRVKRLIGEIRASGSDWLLNLAAGRDVARRRIVAARRLKGRTQ